MLRNSHMKPHWYKKKYISAAVARARITSFLNITRFMIFSIERNVYMKEYNFPKLT